MFSLSGLCRHLLSQVYIFARSWDTKSLTFYSLLSFLLGAFSFGSTQFSMKALVFRGARDIRHESYPGPELETDNKVILKVERCSICGSDLHIYHGDQIGGAGGTNYGNEVAQFRVGHEFAGEVVKVGKNVRKYKVGQKVFSAGDSACGKCNECLTGNINGCRGWTALGLSNNLNGGQAEYVNVPIADFILHPVPEGVTAEQSILLTDAMCTAYFGLTRTDLQHGDTVAVVGLGPIGLIGVELAQILGASEVYAIDPVANRREHAAKLGAIALDPKAAPGVIFENTKGLGIARVFEASGARSAVELAITIAGRGSTASFIGLPQPDVTIPMIQVLFKDITIRAGVASVRGEWPNLIPLLQHGRLKAEGLFSHQMSLSEGEQAYRIFDAREDDVVKIMVNI